MDDIVDEYDEEITNIVGCYRNTRNVQPVIDEEPVDMIEEQDVETKQELSENVDADRIQQVPEPELNPEPVQQTRQPYVSQSGRTVKPKLPYVGIQQQQMSWIKT